MQFEKYSCTCWENVFSREDPFLSICRILFKVIWRDKYGDLFLLFKGYLFLKFGEGDGGWGGGGGGGAGRG